MPASAKSFGWLVVDSGGQPAIGRRGVHWIPALPERRRRNSSTSFINSMWCTRAYSRTTAEAKWRSSVQSTLDGGCEHGIGSDYGLCGARKNALSEVLQRLDVPGDFQLSQRPTSPEGGGNSKPDPVPSAGKGDRIKECSPESRINSMRARAAPAARGFARAKMLVSRTILTHGWAERGPWLLRRRLRDPAHRREALSRQGHPSQPSGDRRSLSA